MAIDAICQRGSIRDADVALLRRAFTHEAHITAGDVDALFRAHTLARVQDPAWSDFFVDTMTDYVVRELEPIGYITAAHAGWLIARVSSAGRIRSKTEHDLLVNVIDKARWAPESLIVFALSQIRDAVVTGEGPLRIGSIADEGCITPIELEQVRCLLFAYGADGPSAITQAEADVLIDIDAAITARRDRTGVDDAAWGDLFDKAITSAVLSASGYAGPSREEALCEALPLTRSAAALGARPAGIDGLADYILSQYARQSGENAALARLEHQRIEIITGEPVTAADPQRLAARAAGAACEDGSGLDRVLAMLEASGCSLHPAFQTPARSGTNAA
jgi:hypothetical protein